MLIKNGFLDAQVKKSYEKPWKSNRFEIKSSVSEDSD